MVLPQSGALGPYLTIVRAAAVEDYTKYAIGTRDAGIAACTGYSYRGRISRSYAVQVKSLDWLHLKKRRMNKNEKTPVFDGSR